MRQTTLTAEELIIRLENGDTEYPRCLYVNELGELAQKGDTTAESALVGFLEPEEGDQERAAAYLHLKCCRHPLAKTTIESLWAFERLPMNTGILAWAYRDFDIIPGRPA
jgi:hypothetical protein